MRRDYFTCVFLACIAGALVFVWLRPLYFIYGGITDRTFEGSEVVFSAIYTLFFLLCLPIYSAYKRKYWILVGLGCYGILPFLPSILYPAQSLIEGEEANLVSAIGAMCLRGIYGMVNAPFAAMSTIVGNQTALSFSKMILPIAIIVPFIFKVFRFYTNAYAQEQLNPAEHTRHSSHRVAPAPENPEVLGTVISAPVNAASPEEVSKKAANSMDETKMHMVPPVIELESGEDKPIELEAPKAIADSNSPYDESGAIRL